MVLHVQILYTNGLQTNVSINCTLKLTHTSVFILNVAEILTLTLWFLGCLENETH